MLQAKNKKPLLWLVFGIAILSRLAFIVLGSKFTPNGSLFINGDSSSYSLSIINFLEKGIYSFDLENADAPFGRLPGYPVFWGLHYILFKNSTHVAVAITQAILDAAVVFLLYSIIKRLTNNPWLALAAGLIYATYFLAIFWVPVTGTESLGIFISILFLYILSKEKYESSYWYLSLGICSAVAFYIREYLGILFFLTGLYLFIRFLQGKIKFKAILVYGLSFFCLYTLWPIRNYISYNRIEFLKPPTAGYERYGKDVAAFRSWMYTWHTDMEPYMTRIIKREDPDFPMFIKKNEKENSYIQHLLDSAMTCGSSFYKWKYYKTFTGVNCNSYVARGFDSLKNDFIKRYPTKYYLEVPFLNVIKALFKSGLSKEPTSTWASLLFNILFGWRTLFVLLGCIGFYFMPRSIVGFVVCAFPLFMYVFICYFIRQVEMRYLLQADVVLLIPAFYLINLLISKFLIKKQNSGPFKRLYLSSAKVKA